jgi:hypothetical protein
VVIGRRADDVDQLLDSEDILVIQNGAFSVLGGAGNDWVYSGTLSGLGRGMPLQLTEDGPASALRFERRSPAHRSRTSMLRRPSSRRKRRKHRSPSRRSPLK